MNLRAALCSVAAYHLVIYRRRNHAGMEGWSCWCGQRRNEDPIHEVPDLNSVTWHNTVQAIAVGLGVGPLTLDEIDELLWEHTSFPVGAYRTVLAEVVDVLSRDGRP